MRRFLRTATAAVFALLAVPNVALAGQSRFSSATFDVHFALSAIGLMIAVFLLIEALGVRKLAAGGLVAQRIGFVVLAVICLAASALADWAMNFVVDLTAEQVQLASQVLVIVAMALLAVYFWHVRSGLKGYMDSASSYTGLDDLEVPPADSPENE
jgi:hypothetical protein